VLAFRTGIGPEAHLRRQTVKEGKRERALPASLAALSSWLAPPCSPPLPLSLSLSLRRSSLLLLSLKKQRSPPVPSSLRRLFSSPPMTPAAATSTMPQSSAPPQNDASGAAQAQAPAQAAASVAEEPAQTFGIKEVRRGRREEGERRRRDLSQASRSGKNKKTHNLCLKKKNFNSEKHRPTRRPASPTPAPSAGQTPRQQQATAAPAAEEEEEEEGTTRTARRQTSLSSAATGCRSTPSASPATTTGAEAKVPLLSRQRRPWTGPGSSSFATSRSPEPRPRPARSPPGPRGSSATLYS